MVLAANLRPGQRRNARAVAARAPEAATHDRSSGRDYVPLNTDEGGELTISYLANKYAWDLRDGNKSVGRIFITRHEVSGADGSWRAETQRGTGPVVFQPLTSNGLVATYYPRSFFRGGRISYSTGQSYVVRQRLVSGVFRLIQSDGTELLELRAQRPTRGQNGLATFRAKLRPTSDAKGTALLAILTTCYAVLVLEPRYPVPVN
jgi:hypothetical protein